MTERECLKLTTYGGERDRTGGRLLADALLELYTARRLQASVVVRGAEGFGRLHHLHTDRLLSLSDDLPVVTVAVDRRDRIEALVEPVLSVMRKGLVTLERAQLLTDELGEVGLPEALHEATKLTVYVGRRERVNGEAAHVAVCRLLHRCGVEGASVLLGVDGTVHGRRRRARFFSANAEVPTMIVAVGPGAAIGRALPELGRLLHAPLLTLERVRVCKRDGELLARPHVLPPTDGRGLAMWQKLMVYTSQGVTTVHGRPLSLEIVRRLRETGGAGATNLRGIWGFHGDHPPRGERVFQLRRRVPMLTVTVDTPQRTADAFTIIDELTAEHGLVTSEMVPAMTAMSADRTVGGLALAAHEF